MLGRGFWVAGVGIVALVVACSAPGPGRSALVVRGTNIPGSAPGRRNEVRIVEVPSPTFTVVSAGPVSSREEAPPTPPPDAVVVRLGRTTKRDEASPAETGPPGTPPIAGAKSRVSRVRPTCTPAYLRLLARVHRDTAIGRKAGAVADRYLLAREIEPRGPAGRMIRPYLLGTALYDSGEIPYPANPNAYGTGSHYARALPKRPLARRSLGQAVREALKSPHHALHFRDRLEAAREAGLVPIRAR